MALADVSEDLAGTNQDFVPENVAFVQQGQKNIGSLVFSAEYCHLQGFNIAGKELGKGYAV